jgi:hypothetical protein
MATWTVGGLPSASKSFAVPISKFQSDVLRQLAAQRSSDSYIAGGIAINPHFSHSRGCWLGPCRANSFSHLANTPGIGGGAKTCWHDNALRHHPATV